MINLWKNGFSLTSKKLRQNFMSRHHQTKFCYIMSRQCLDIIFLPILKNSRKKLIFLENNCFRVSHMGCEARFLSLMVFLSFPQLNFIFRASILNCTAALFARFRYFKKGCRFYALFHILCPLIFHWGSFEIPAPPRNPASSRRRRWARAGTAALDCARAGVILDYRNLCWESFCYQTSA